MGDISRKNYEINGIETIGNDRVLRLNQNHIEEKFAGDYIEISFKS